MLCKQPKPGILQNTPWAKGLLPTSGPRAPGSGVPNEAAGARNVDGLGSNTGLAISKASPRMAVVLLEGKGAN